MIYLHCPDFVNGLNIYKNLKDLETTSPYIFEKDVTIGSIFGCFPGMTWNGGGFSIGYTLLDIEYFKDIANIYKELNIPIKFTLTNKLLTKEDCYDRYCNKVLDIFNNGNNEILINSPILENYLRQKYPNYKFVKSITSTEQDFDLNEALTIYNTIVLPKRYNKNFDLLNSIPFNNRQKIEILCNENCVPNCPRLYSHYEDFNKVQLYEISKFEPINTCSQNKPLFKDKENPNYISLENFKSNYYSLGYNQLKISGRGGPENGSHVAGNVLPYLIKPEYQLEVMTYLMSN